MPRIINGTQTLNNGRGVLEPTGTDRGEKFTQIVVEFMRQYATHSHNGSDSSPATLPNGSAGYLDSAPTMTTDSLGRQLFSYRIVIPNTNKDTVRSASFFYRTAEPDTLDNWKSLVCDYYITEQVAEPKNLVVVLTGLTVGDLTNIKVVI